MENFINRLRSHIEHVKKVGGHCTTEETTKQALILGRVKLEVRHKPPN